MEKIINQEKIVEAVKNIPMTAERESWVFTLDKEEGTLFYSPKKIPDDARLHQVTSEYALYLNKELQPKGVMVECYNVNFLKHDDVIKKISSVLFSGGSKVEVVDPNTNQKDEAEIMRGLFESKLLRDVATDLLPA